MADDLKALVEKALKDSILSFNRNVQGSFETWDAELERVERLVVLERASAGREDWLASIRAERIRLAWEVGKSDLLLERSQRFLQDSPPRVASYGTVVEVRARALHEAGAHGEERTLVLEAAAEPEIRGSEYVSLLAGLARRHAGSIPPDARVSRVFWTAGEHWPVGPEGNPE